MRNAETILGIIRERGTQGLPLDDSYRPLYNPQLYLHAYGRIYRNAGAMTPGITAETVDGMSLAQIASLIDDLRHERYQWKPVRQVYIEQKHSTKKRPLGVPTWSDKLLQEVLRLILEAYYEPQFSRSSHGFRPQRGCHTALREIYHRWVGAKWFVEGDIAACFDSLDHTVLMSVLREKIQDNRFLRRLENVLRAGYLEEWKFNTTLSGSPQGAVLSPLLLNRLKWVMERSLVQTLAHKLRVSIREIYRRYQTTIQTDHGPRVGLQVTVERQDGRKPLITRWGGISLSRNMQATLDDAPLRVCGPRTELAWRLVADTCELCGSQEAVEVHHIRALKDLHRKGQTARPFWIQVMAARQRKTLGTCRQCHTAIHRGEPTQKDTATEKTLESRVLRKA